MLPVAAFYGSDVRINRFARLAIDGNVSVRRRFVRVVTDWAHDLPDRIDHQARLLPYLLSAVHDDNPSVRCDALDQVRHRACECLLAVVLSCSAVKVCVGVVFCTVHSGRSFVRAWSCACSVLAEVSAVRGAHANTCLLYTSPSPRDRG